MSINNIKAEVKSIKAQSGLLKWSAAELDSEAKALSNVIAVLGRNALTSSDVLKTSLIEKYSDPVYTEVEMKSPISGKVVKYKEKIGQTPRLTIEEIGTLLVNALYRPTLVARFTPEAFKEVTEALRREGFFPAVTADSILNAAAKARGLTPEGLAKTAKRLGIEGTPRFCNVYIPTAKDVKASKASKAKKAA